MNRYRLVGTKLCPFFQRVALTFLEKRLDFEPVFIDPANKPEWFMALSPRGRNPLLAVDGHVLFESAAMAEFVDELASPPLMPIDPFLRAEVRAWVSATGEAFQALFAVMAAADQASLDRAATELRSKLAAFEARLEGPLFNGSAFSPVDAAMAPLLQRVTWLDDLTPRPNLLSDLPKVAAWRDVLLSRDTVQRSAPPDARRVLLDYLAQRPNAAVWFGSTI